jgi:beta-phosphoglucomutase-like phosphatase (HAD superfamily)
MIEALIFDFDGLILDTETPDYLSWKSASRRLA